MLWEQEDKRSPSKACLFFSVGDLVPGLGRAEALRPGPTLSPTCLFGALQQDVTDPARQRGAGGRWRPVESSRPRVCPGRDSSWTGTSPVSACVCVLIDTFQCSSRSTASRKPFRTPSLPCPEQTPAPGLRHTVCCHRFCVLPSRGGRIFIHYPGQLPCAWDSFPTSMLSTYSFRLR